MDLISRLETLDKNITFAINALHSPCSDAVMVFFSKKLVWIPFYLAIAVFLIWRLGWKRGLILIAAALCTFGCIDFLTNVIKHASCRIRPLHDPDMVAWGIHVLESGGGYSFPSAHAANAFGLATCTLTGLSYIKNRKGKITEYLRKRHRDIRNYSIGYGIVLFFWAFMVAVSRIFVAKHFFGDVIIGILFGITVGLLFGLLFRLISMRISN